MKKLLKQDDLVKMMAEAIKKVPPLSDCRIVGFKDGKMLLKRVCPDE